MKILLIRPRPSDDTIGLQHVMVVEPLELEVIGALVTRPDEAVIVDLVLEKEDLPYFLRLHRPDVLGVTGYITNVPAMKAACQQAKAANPALVTIVGGVHVEVCPADLDDPAVDFRVVRNAVAAFPALMAHLHGQGPVPPGVLGPGERVAPSLLPAFEWRAPRPARHLVDRYRDRYFYIFQDRVALVKASFGCPYQCSFCFCRAITGGQYHERDIEDVVDEIAALPQQEIYLVDDDFLVSRERVTAFVEALQRRALRKRFLVYGRADFIARNEVLLALFREAGLRTVIVGFESFSDRDLQRWNKGTTAGVNEEAMRVLNRLNIDCFATIILPPHWDRADFARCGQTLARLGIHYVNLQPLTPLPGTGQTVDERDLLIPRHDFEKWDLAHVMIRPEKLSERAYYQELVRLYLAALYRPSDLVRLARKYPRRMLGKMILGTLRVQQQYRRKIRAASDEPPVGATPSRGFLGRWRGR